MTISSYRITIADKIKAYRSENNLSLKEFGNLIGVSAQAVCKWEQKLAYPDIFTLPYLARILGCQTDDFFEINPQSPNHLTQNTISISEQ